jgi:hypothetical protein
MRWPDIHVQGRIQDFKLEGAHLKKLRRVKGGAKIFGVFRVKHHDFTPKNHIFSNFRGGGPGAPPPGSAPGVVNANKAFSQKHYSSHTCFYILRYAYAWQTMSYSTGAISGTGTAYSSGAPEITPNFWCGLCSSIFSFLCCVWRITAWLFYFGHTVVCLYWLLLSLIDRFGTLYFLFLLQFKNNFISWWKSKFKNCM